MGQIWGAAQREEGYKLGKEDPILIWGLKVVAMTGHGIWRFFSGRPLLGDQHRKTHATWSQGSNKPIRSTQRPPAWWSRLAEKHRAAIRVGLLIIAIDIMWGWWSGPFSSLRHDSFDALGVVVIWWALYLLTHKTRGAFTDRRHNKGFVEPFKSAIAPILGTAKEAVTVRIPAINRKESK